MSALTSLIRLSASFTRTISPIIAAVSETEPFISHANALVDSLEDSNPEKQYFRALAGLAKATTLLCWQKEAPNGLARDIRKRFIKLLHLYR